MKKLITKKLIVSCLILVTLITSGASSVFATSSAYGKGYISYWRDNKSSVTTGYSISNITDTPINVKVTLYKDDGTVFVDDGSSTSGSITNQGTGSNYNDQLSDATVSFTLDAHCSAYIVIHNLSETNSGYGTIEWTQDNSSVTTGLVAHGTFYSSDNSRFDISINGSNPF